ncbi:hypothetical protein CYY_000754 [Polysphondylium violaceum]|uniref:Uncharacterized protein n=1 Tax=Polysphondylium violaceum TaxID=133409 RepID=A0A8J4VB90_9MYCE|nr:hypothetical protein CYY_000754 [Polysphondylium violaceum]
MESISLEKKPQVAALLFNHKDHLPTHFGNLKIVGTATEEIVKYRALHASEPRYTRVAALAATTDTSTLVQPEQQPVISCTDYVKQIYQSNNFNMMGSLQDQAQRDIQPILDNIKEFGDAAWVKVEALNGEQFYMTWTQNASIWSYTPTLTPSTDADKVKDPNAKFQAVAQFGTYSNSTNIAGTQSFKIGLIEQILKSVCSLIIAKAVSTLLPEGLSFLASQFSEAITQSASSIGLNILKFIVPAEFLGPIAGNLVFTVIFIGLKMLWDWMNREYSIRVQVFNWDTVNDWQLTKQAKSNAVNPGLDPTINDFNLTIKKMSGMSDGVYPPDFTPRTSFDTVVHYALIVYGNDSKFMEGLSFAIDANIATDTTTGFSYCFKCPRLANNAQYVQGSVVDAEKFLKDADTNGNWSAFLQQQVTAGGKPIAVCLDRLNGAPDNLYNINVHINAPQ